ncbi:ectonucleoside triphosphate diphosphohydrolase 3 isoform 4-T5 [Anomaloglossus baeobatrachus]|uniref:ectonucleoside triphosphate diphosphohydrolase 3 isoform X4 n=1 Tax=Anomaloglossus baeobatrachus TaxID=238106 RepID=UPI003F50C8DA
MPSKVKIPLILSILFLLISVSVIIAIAYVQIHHERSLSPGLKYGIVLDAGSSRTTVYVYQWPAEKENNTGVVSQTFKCNVNGLGISSYASEPEKAAKNIDNCMKKVISVIPFNQQNSTPVYLGATAGMRLLRLKNESAAQGVLFSIENYFQTQPFSFRGAHIITGQEEGVYGWITVNYLMGNFLEKNIWSTWVRPDGAETTGALDLGGASTQISFIPEKSEQNPNSTLEVTLYGYKYNVYTHSFQCYGRDESEKRLLASLAKSSQGKPHVENPCYPQNYKAFSGFYYTANALNLTGNFQLPEFNTSMSSFCSQEWSKLPHILSRFDETYARSYCFSANYIYHLLVHGYKFNSESWPQILFQKEVGNSSIAWSLGYMLNLTNMIPAERPLILLPMRPTVFAGLLFLFAAISLLCLILLVILMVRAC